MEISGPDGKEKAKKLAEKLSRFFANKPQIRIAQPQKLGELRVGELDPSTMVEEVGRAVAEQGDCSLIEIKVGSIH